MGGIVYVNGHPHHIVNKTHKSVSVLDMYHNKLTRRKTSTEANVEFKQTWK
jgi:hypothetical protein